MLASGLDYLALIPATHVLKANMHGVSYDSDGIASRQSQCITRIVETTAFLYTINHPPISSHHMHYHPSMHHHYLSSDICLLCSLPPPNPTHPLSPAHPPASLQFFTELKRGCLGCVCVCAWLAAARCGARTGGTLLYQVCAVRVTAGLQQEQARVDCHTTGQIYVVYNS